MAIITIYKIRSDGVFDGNFEYEVFDAEKSPIPSGYTRSSPHPIPTNHYAIMNSGWKYIAGDAPPAPTPDYKSQNKSQAEFLLQESDWVEYKSVRDTTRTPHLLNGDEFDDYRVALRGIAVNPPETEVTDWPVKPDEEWSN